MKIFVIPKKKALILCFAILIIVYVILSYFSVNYQGALAIELSCNSVISEDFKERINNLTKGDEKIAYLTFDDGPSQYTDKILQILKKHNAYATFFVVGIKVSFYDDTLREILKQGSEIGNHSYSHKLLTRLSEEEFKEDLNKTQEVIKKITGFTPKVFRPTYGGYTSKIKKYTDLSFVLWDVDSRDWEVKKKNKILKNVLPNVKSGSIVLMHDNHEYSLKALDTMIKELKADGYKFVTVSELLEFKNLKEE